MKSQYYFWLFILSFTAICGCYELQSKEQLPIKIAVVCDLTTSQDSKLESLVDRIYDVVAPLYDSLLPKGSEIVFFPVSSVQGTRSFAATKFLLDHHDRSARLVYFSKNIQMNKSGLRDSLQSRYNFEMRPDYAKIGQSCIENTVIDAASFLRGSPNCIRRMLVVSDFLEQCKYSELAKREWWLEDGAQKFHIEMDSLRSLLGHWEIGQVLEGVEVVAIKMPTKKAPSPNSPSGLEIQSFWEKVFERLGVKEPTNLFYHNIPSGFLSQ